MPKVPAELLSKFPVALVSMPFASVSRPSIQIGLLSAIAAQAGAPVATFHFSVDFAQQIGLSLYERLSQHRGVLFGDWLFSVAAFGQAAPDPDGKLLLERAEETRELLGDLRVNVERLLEVRSLEVPRFVESLLDVQWEEFRVVGFTSTFQQTVASFAFAVALKRRWPNLVTLFGGANFDGEMGEEFARSVPCIDYVISGEADRAFPDFLKALASGGDPGLVPGVIPGGDGHRRRQSPSVPFGHLDSLPVPDYGEYFDRVKTKGLWPALKPFVVVPFESSRGCWWGERQHCVFCGLNGDTMKYRKKSSDRLQRELEELVCRHRVFRLEAVDNILAVESPQGLPGFLADCASKQVDYQFFYEVKSNLSRRHVRALHQGGVRRIQPGIESLNTKLLRLMRKGVTAALNVNLLRWSLHYGIKVNWSILYGIPGEAPEEYQEQESLMGLLPHLPPPMSAKRLWLERFSPMFLERDAFPYRYVRPESSYYLVFPSRVAMDKIAYFFDYQLEEGHRDAFYEPTRKRVEEWKQRWKGAVRPTLVYRFCPSVLQMEDRRDPLRPRIIHYDGPAASLYLACSDAPKELSSLEERSFSHVSRPRLQSMLDEFCALGLMMQDGSQFLSLALPASPGR